MEKVLTADNSETFFSDQYKETYHSKSGAIEESLKKFVEPCQVSLKAKNKKIVLLDVCFGLGYNTAVAIDVIKENNPECGVEVFALENDVEILKKIEEVNPKIKCYDEMKEMVRKVIKEFVEKNKITIKNKEEAKRITIQHKDIIMHMYLDDARIAIKQIKERADAVFLDPFSPKVCPELWTEEFFKDIKQTMKKDAILATYSCARIVRDNLKAAGFEVKDGPCVGRRAPSTMGYLDYKKL